MYGTALNAAVSHGHEKVWQTLVDHGACVDDRPPSGPVKGTTEAEQLEAAGGSVSREVHSGTKQEDCAAPPD